MLFRGFFIRFCRRSSRACSSSKSANNTITESKQNFQQQHSFLPQIFTEEHLEVSHDLDDEMRPFQLVCVRHGESAWNKDNKFCGWVDVPLSENGTKEAYQAAQAIKDEKIIFDSVFTSILKRANDTANIIIDSLDPKPREVIRHWRLNERHYGALTGLNKAEMAEIHGKEQVQIWRRSFDVPPPPMTEEHLFYKEIHENPSFKNILDQIPSHESLKDLIERIQPFWQSTIVPTIRDGQRVLIVAHGTSLRALVKTIEDLSEEEVTQLNLPNSIPFVYDLDPESLKPLKPKRYLADEETVQKAVNKVASIGPKKNEQN